MAFQVSPGVLVQEKDLTNVIPAVATTIGAVAGQFSQGPMDEVVSIASLFATFRLPDRFNHVFGNLKMIHYVILLMCTEQMVNIHTLTMTNKKTS